MCISTGDQLVDGVQPGEKNPLVSGGVFGSAGVKSPVKSKCIEWYVFFLELRPRK